MAPELQAVLKFAQVAQQVLALRVLTFAGFGACAALFGYALYVPTWERAVIASLFAVLVYLPLLRVESKSPGA